MCHNHHLRRAKARAHGFLLHHSAQLHNLSYLSGEHNCTRFPTSGQGYFLRRRHGVHHLLLLITAPEPSQPLYLEQQDRNNLLSSTFHQVARSEIAPQSNGSCPIICPRHSGLKGGGVRKMFFSETRFVLVNWVKLLDVQP